MGEATRFLFGDTTKEWPEGFCLVHIKFLSPELEQYLNESGVLVYRAREEDGSELEALVLITPESDREHLAQALLQIQVNEGNDQPELIGRETHPVPMENYTTALMFSAALGDTTLLKILLDLGADPNKRDSRGNTALMIAARHGHLDAVQILMHDPKIQVNLKNMDGRSALFYAAAQGHLEIFSLLLVVGGAILEREGPKDWEQHAFLIAANNGHYAICKYIIETGMDVDIQDTWGSDTALQLATAAGKIECCKVLIDAGANVNHFNEDGYNILQTAIIRNQFEVFELLIARGAALIYPEYTYSLLTEAAAFGRFEFIKRLIELKVDVNLVHQGTTALHMACKGGHLAATKALLEAGANPNIPDAFGFNALADAAERGDVALLSLLIKHGAKVRSKHHFGYLALGRATAARNLEAVKFLLSANAPMSVPSSSIPHPGESAPLLAKVFYVRYPKSLDDERNQYDLLDLLLNNGASWREVDTSGNDALMLAVESGVPKLVLRLIEAGATVGQLDANGLNALEKAVRMADDALNTRLHAQPQNFLPIDLLLAVMEGMKRHVDHDSLMRAGLHKAPDQTTLAVMEGMKRQANYDLLMRAALHKAQHLTTRELICQNYAEPLNVPINYTPAIWKKMDVSPILRYACLYSTKDWDRAEIEMQLAAIGTPVPAINFYCDHIDAFPAMKIKLFGPVKAKQVNQDYWTEFFMGIDATMEKMLVVENEIDGAYENLGGHGVRQIMVNSARQKISSAVDSAITAEQLQQTRFAELFDNCLQSTLSTRDSQGRPLYARPVAGMIAADLMRQWVYAALAEHIEKAWHAAWLATIKPAQEATETVFTADEYAAIGSASFLDVVTPITLYAISEQQSSQLLQAFKNALRSSYRDLLKLPNASLKEAALYADLMERQLHMLMQFVNDTAEVETPALMPDSM